MPSDDNPANGTTGAGRTRGLTPKQESFCLAYLETSNASEAYRRAYDCRGSNPNTIARRASELLKDGRVAARLRALRQPVLERVLYDYEQAMREAAAARDLAQEQRNPSAMVAAISLRSKLSGLLVEDRRNQRTALQEMSTEMLEELQRMLDESLAATSGADEREPGSITH